MKWIMCSIVIIFSIIPNVFAEPTSIILEPGKTTYTHGEFLNFFIIVDDVGYDATLYIGDEYDKKDKIPIPINIKDIRTHFIFPYSIDPSIFSEGKYFIFIEYEKLKDSIEFNVVNTENVVIPIADRAAIIPELIPWVVQTDQQEKFIGVVKYFKDNKFIDVQNSINSKSIEKLKVPEWVKNIAAWWIEGKISDHDISISLQYLIQKQIIEI